MKIIIEEKRSEDEEDTIIIRCGTLREPVLKLLQQIKVIDEGLIGMKGTIIHRIALDEVYYFEAVDHKVFAYTKEEVYEIKLKLYEIEQRFQDSDYLRVSKSVILNLRKVHSFSPVLGGRMEAMLDNDEKIIISRQYVSLIKTHLGV